MAARELKYWGWGWVGDGVPDAHRDAALKTFETGFNAALPAPVAVPEVADFALRAPRLKPPATLAEICRDDDRDRLVHALGKSYPDAVKIFARDVANAPDVVIYPRNADDVAAALDWAAEAGAAVIPFGGGSSVVGGVEAQGCEGYAGVVTLDMTRMNAILEIDKTSRAARMQGGIRGPAIEAGLKPHKLTLRHFPQSFEMATLGGMIVTRSGGHYCSYYQHIDELVESVTMVTPAGLWESRRLPGSGAGPSPDRFVCGSEGAFGVLTEAWMRLQDAPTFRASASVEFDDFLKAAEAVRAVAQSGLNPANCRLVDRVECGVMGVNDGSKDVMVLGFESADHPQDARLARAVEIVRGCGGEVALGEGPDANKQGAAGAWRHAFITMPYLREHLVPRSVISDTFETAITWDRFAEFHHAVVAATHKAIEEATGARGMVSCRFTHVYPDGPAPYYSFHAQGRPGAELEQWWRIKRAASEALIAAGGTITHHHAVGRDHDEWCQRQRPAPFTAALIAAKGALDPAGVLNPGVIVPAAR